MSVGAGTAADKMAILRDAATLRERVHLWRREGAIVGLVPTMGALHDGHLSLVRAAQGDCDRVVATVFVNPRQFDNPDDLARYPRTEDTDAALLAPLGVDVLFAPPPEAVYPPGFATTVSVGGLTGRLEGLHRPGHFDGVATVVAKLFGMAGADRAYFGEKDWQQLQLVRRLAADLNIGVTVVGCPTLREADGLAMSSRNVRLSPGARAVAGHLPRVMRAVADGIAAGAPVAEALADGRAALRDAGFEAVDYFDLCDPDSLVWIDRLAGEGRLLAAATVGGVRLIDNMAVRRAPR